MTNNEILSPHRMALLLLVFTTSSTIIFIPSSLLSESGNAFWLAWFLAGIYGMFHLLCMLFLQKRFAGSTLVECGEKTIGHGLTMLLLIPYVVFLLLLSAYIYYSIGIFFTTTMMKETPLVVFNGLIALLSVVTVRGGIAAISRMFSLLAVILIGSIVIVLVLGFDNYHPEFLLPVMPYGVRPVLHSAYQSGGFVYGDFLVFAILFGFMQSRQGGFGKPIIFAFILNWVILLIVSGCIIMALGPMTNAFIYPLFSLARIISVQEIIERGESVIGMSLIAGSFMKATLTLFAANVTITRLFKIKSDRVLLLPIALAGFLLSLVVVRNEFEYAEVLLSWPLITFTASVPIWIIAVAALIKGKQKP